MPRTYIYLETDDSNNDTSSQQPTQNAAQRYSNYKHPETGVKNMDSAQISKLRKDEQRNVVNSTKETAGSTRNVAYLGKEEITKQRKEKQNEKAAQQKAAQTQISPEENKNNNSASTVLDEENDDASIIDNKSKEEQDKEVKPEDIKNEKQPLQEFMDVFKNIIKG